MNQSDILTLVEKLCENDEFRGFGFSPASVMATIEVESSFEPAAYRMEPRLGEASYGLMQVLPSTAKQMGWKGTSPVQLYDPTLNITLGMRYLRWGWDYLQRHLKRRPTLDEWAAGYNEGYGAVAKRRPDPPYSDNWVRARDTWLRYIVRPT